MNNNPFETNETINPFTIIKETCAGLLPLPSAMIYAAHEFSKEELLRERAELEKQATGLNADVLSAVSSLKALENKKESEPVSYIDLIKRLRTRSKNHDHE